MSRHHKATPNREWERIRQRAILRDGHRCTNCGKPGRLEVHHIAPVSEGGTNAQENLLTLCRDCHIRSHGDSIAALPDEWQEMINGLRVAD